MIKTIVFTGCGHHRLMAEYCSRNAAQLAEHGVLYPKSASRELSFGYDHYPIVHFLDTSAMHSVLQQLHAIKEEFLSASGGIKTLCLLLPAIVYSNPRYLRIVQMNCKRLFPSAEMKIFFSILRQDIYLKKNITTCCYAGYAGCDYFLYEKKFPLPDYAKLFKQLNVPALQDVVYHFSPKTASPSAYDIVSGLNAALELPRPAAEALASAFHPRYAMVIPREVIRFIVRSTVSQQKFTPFISLEPWAGQLHHFTPEAGYVPGVHALFSPKHRSDVLERFTQSNEDAAHMLGVERLFPEPEPEPDWEPFPGLTEETAFQVAERLDRDFAQARMAEFDATPLHYLTREQRLCRQALHDTLDPPSSISLPRVALPQPRLSVLTLTYNHAPYIVECMESVIAQKTDFPFQHIIADDGSDDGTQEIILDYAARYPHLVPVFQKTRSHGWLNVQSLFDMARTEYVALCDGDDYFTDPGKLQTQADFLDAHPDCGLCFHVVRVLYEGGAFRERFYPPVAELPRGIRPFYYLGDLCKCNFIQTNSAMYRWRFRNGLPDWFRPDLMPGDWYWHLLHAETGKIGFINKVMSVYRRHKESVYYLSEVDRLKHRHVTGLEELTMYDVVNDHFKKQFENIFLELANCVFADCLLYGNNINDFALVETLMEKFPRFGRNFLQSVEIVDNVNAPPAEAGGFG